MLAHGRPGKPHACDNYGNAADTVTVAMLHAVSNAPLNRRYGFLLLPEFSMLSFAAAVEPLRMANRSAGAQLFEWDLYSLDDGPVPASNGMQFDPTRARTDTDGLTTLLVVAGIGAHLVTTAALGRWLRGLSRRGVLLGATSTGSLLLARAGLLRDERCTIHWENADSLREEFPRLRVSGELYELEERVITCSGGMAGLDMMLQLIRMSHGDALANSVAEQCIHPSIRPAHAAQRMPPESRWHITSPRLLNAVALMQSHLEDTLSTGKIASLVGISVRQLERLFRQSFDLSPAEFYLRLRLERGRHLLEQSVMSVMEIASACGFSSASHFARWHKRRYGCTPKAVRGSRKTSAGRSPA